MNLKKTLTALAILLMSFSLTAQQIPIPKSFSNITYKDGKMGVDYEGKFYPAVGDGNPYLTFDNIITPKVKSWEKGIELDFGRPELEGTIYYGLINHDSRYREVIFSKRTAKIKKGKAQLNLDKLKGKYDFTAWEKNGMMQIGYRIVDKKGRIVADNRQNVLYQRGQYVPDYTLIEGPVLSKPRPDGITISFRLSEKASATLRINNQEYSLPSNPLNLFEVDVNGLKPSTVYEYEIIYGLRTETYSFKTAPLKGCRAHLRFAYASDSRNGKGGGERNIFGTNTYVLRRMMIAADREDADFFMFTGDMINGYSGSRGLEELQYYNYKNVLRYFAAYHPVYVGMGNHEALSQSFHKFDSKAPYAWERYISVDKFPFETESGERLFSDMFAMPENGPVSEDGSKYDPSRRTKDFPPYGETAYWFTYGNVAFVVMNSNYWYTTNENYIPIVGGNPHAYIMDNQMKWLENTLKKLDADPSIDHVFVSVHTPLFPNAGHAENDMWYFGNNDIRPWVAGKPVDKGIIERRDQLLDIMVNRSEKFRALLSGDEHNYTRLVVDNYTDIYPKDWEGERIKLKRPFVQITNGAAGAPYYAPEKLPWSDHLQTYSTQNALMIFDVDGPVIHVRVFNPDTFEPIEHFEIH